MYLVFTEDINILGHSHILEGFRYESSQRNAETATMLLQVPILGLSYPAKTCHVWSPTGFIPSFSSDSFSSEVAPGVLACSTFRHL